MQKRPFLKEHFTLQKHFIGFTIIGSRDVWISLGNYIDFKGGRNNLHKHSFYEVCLVLEGEGRFHHGDKYYSLEDGDLFIALPGIDHEIVSSGTNHLKIQFISFSFQKVRENKTDETNALHNHYISTFLNLRPIQIKDCAALESHFKQLQIISENSNRGEWYLQNEGIARNLIVNIIIKSVQKEVKEIHSPSMDSRLQLALNFIKDNPFRRLTIDEIAGQSCTSARTLRRLMKNYCGKTVILKSLEIRIKTSADYLISHPEKNISEVSDVFGFENPSDFGRGFRQVMKVSPGVFRKNKGTVFT